MATAWSKKQQTANRLKITKAVKCYSSSAIVSPAHMSRIGAACQIRKGTIEVKYNSKYDAMEVTKCDNPKAAKGKYIKSPDGTEVVSYSKTEEIKWPVDSISVNAIKTTGGIVLYKNNNGKLENANIIIPKDTNLDVKYDIDLDAMKITGPIISKYVGYYIKTPDNTKVTKRVATVSESTYIIDSNTGKFTPATINADGIVTASTTPEGDPIEIDEDFLEEYSTIMSADEYKSKLKSGLRVRNLRGVLGMPHQFLPTADPRIDDNAGVGDVDAFGRVYSEKIIKNIPLLLMTPGVPKFMSAFDKKTRDTTLGQFLSAYNKSTNVNDLLNGENGKFYSLKFAYNEYYYYVNAMLRTAAVYLGLGNEEIDGVKLGTNDWSNDTSKGNALYDSSYATFLKPYYGCVAFYADVGTSIDDSFSNSTTESSLVSGTLNSLSDKAREINFLVGSVGSQVGLSYDTIEGLTGAGDAFEDIGTKVDEMLGKKGFLSNILNKGSTILAGGRLVFPEIWSDSSFSRSYSCSMKLVSPSGDKLSVYWNILVPIYHLLAFTMPREATDQAYFSPFLVRGYYKGLFNVDMGIIPGLSVTKGDEGEWTVDGIPTVANVSFEIKDLYEGMYMSKISKDGKAQGILSNIQELDYIANSCGINVNDQEVMRMIKLVTALQVSNINDKITLGIFGNISQFFNQKMNNIFGVF